MIGGNADQYSRLGARHAALLAGGVATHKSSSAGDNLPSERIPLRARFRI
jgi:hypothetical protein